LEQAPERPALRNCPATSRRTQVLVAELRRKWAKLPRIFIPC